MQEAIKPQLCSVQVHSPINDELFGVLGGFEKLNTFDTKLIGISATHLETLSAEDSLGLLCFNKKGGVVHLSALITIEDQYGDDRIVLTHLFKIPVDHMTALLKHAPLFHVGGLLDDLYYAEYEGVDLPEKPALYFDDIRPIKEEEFDYFNPVNTDEGGKVLTIWDGPLEKKWNDAFGGYTTLSTEEKEELRKNVDRKDAINVSQIPLNNRCNRTIVRNYIKVTSDTLSKTGKSEEELFDHICQVDGIDGEFLKATKDLDALPDDEYVEKFITFMQASARALWNKDIESGLTELSFPEWVKHNYRVEMEDLGRAQALEDIGQIEEPKEGMMKKIDVKDNSAFLVELKHCMLEFDGITYGPHSPYSVDVVKLLLYKGHEVYLLAGQTTIEADMAASLGLDHLPIVSSIPADGKILDKDIDFIIHSKNIGNEFLDLSDTGTLTLFWGPVIQYLAGRGYITEEEITNLILKVNDETNEGDGQ